MTARLLHPVVTMSKKPSHREARLLTKQLPCVRITEPMHASLSVECERIGLDVSEAVRDAVAAWLAHPEVRNVGGTSA